MAARFISASAIKVGLGPVVANMPPVWRPGDMLLTMGFAPPIGPDNYSPVGWTRVATYNWVRAAASGQTPPTVQNSTPGAPIAVIMAAFRGVDTNPDLRPNAYSLSAITEYGGETSAPGTYAAPDRGVTPKLTAGACGYSLGPAPRDGSLAIASFQSEGTDSSPLDVHVYPADTALTQLAMDYAALVYPTNGDTYHFRLGFFAYPLIAAGGYAGQLRWGVTGSGGGRSGGTQVPKPGPAAWFSQVLLAASVDPGPDLDVMPPGPVVDGAVTLIGSKAAGSSVTVNGDAATETTPTTWEYPASVGPGTNTFAVSDGTSTVSVDVAGSVVLPAPALEGSGSLADAEWTTSEGVPLIDAASGRWCPIRYTPTGKPIWLRKV